MGRKMTKKTTLDIWSEICQKFVSKDTEALVHPIHTCIIEGQRHYVHAPNLKKEYPQYFEKLCHFAKKYNITLKADRRCATEAQAPCRRKKLLPVVFLALSTNTSISAADDKTSLKLFSLSSSHISEKNEHYESAFPEAQELTYGAIQSARIERILTSHFSSEKGDLLDIDITDEINSLAKYYAKHPEAVSLIESIADASWQLKYAPHTFQTDISGSRMSINKVTVYFDPRSGAKLKFYDKCSDKKPFCVASPADALLHELLHVQTIVNDTEEFIAQGGLGQHAYPVEHERLTILKENILYKSMSRRDQQHRPIRSEHSGRHVLVSCVTCFE